MNLTTFSYNQQTINQREDGYLCASQMCQANNKKLNDWTRLKSTQEYILELSIETGIPVTDLLEVNHGTLTWVHPSLAINLARWISAKFAVWCDAHIFNLMTTGKTSIEVKTPQTYLEALKALVASEEEKEILKLQNEQLEQENELLSEAVDELFSYSSIIRVAKFNNMLENKFNYHRLKAVSAKIGIEPKKVPCPRFEYKLLYHHDAWRIAYPDVSLPETITIRVA